LGRVVEICRNVFGRVALAPEPVPEPILMTFPAYRHTKKLANIGENSELNRLLRLLRFLEIHVKLDGRREDTREQFSGLATWRAALQEVVCVSLKIGSIGSVI
jgi:hypothetical protein